MDLNKTIDELLNIKAAIDEKNMLDDCLMSNAVLVSINTNELLIVANSINRLDLNTVDNPLKIEYDRAK